MHPGHSPPLTQKIVPTSFQPIPRRSKGTPCFISLIAFFSCKFITKPTVAVLEYVVYCFYPLRYAVFGWYSQDDWSPGFDTDGKVVDNHLWLTVPLLNVEVRRAAVAYGLFFHFLILMVFVAFTQTSCTDPGSVPRYWGFHVGDESKRRRYCKVCELWKPERTHHCSACGRCVLNMDHHCPWVNNCIGFYNRKFFVQLLVYALLTLSLVASHTAYHLYFIGHSFSSISEWSTLVEIGSCTAILSFALLLILPLVPFLRLHYMLITRNSTTIEDLDVNTRHKRRYDLGPRRNCFQVMGPTWWLWWMPCHTPASLPTGDGVRWNLNYVKVLEAG